MMPRARVVRAPAAQQATPLFSLRPSATHARRIAREELESRLAAGRIEQEARERAAAMVSRAREDATAAAAEVAREARERAEARVAAQWLALRDGEGDRLARDRDRIVAVAVVLAERLLGTALALEPERITDLARVAIDEARGARRVAVEAHPLDAQILRQSLRDARLDPQSVEVLPNEALARGEIRLKTDVGAIDAQLATRLERLAAALRDALP
jgi:flagellar biosynthesis/type III secretory pathway protein FliH